MPDRAAANGCTVEINNLGQAFRGPPAWLSKNRSVVRAVNGVNPCGVRNWAKPWGIRGRKSGCGKSTLAALLLGFFEQATSAEIFIRRAGAYDLSGTRIRPFNPKMRIAAGDHRRKTPGRAKRWGDRPNAPRRV